MHWLVYTYWPEVRGNVYAVLPCALLGFFWLRAKHRALTAAHRAHSAQLKLILQHLDPEAATDGLLDLIADRVDEKTPGGVTAILEAIRSPK